MPCKKLQWDTKSEPLNLVFTLEGWKGRGIQHRIDISKKIDSCMVCGFILMDKTIYKNPFNSVKMVICNYMIS
jgi:hypothetical protein